MTTMSPSDLTKSVDARAQTPLHLRAAGVSLVLDCSGERLPRVLHWGRDLGHLDDAALRALRLTGIPPVVTNSVDVPVPLGVLAEAAVGWSGTPGLVGHRDGTGFSPLFDVHEVQAAVDSVVVVGVDPALELELRLQVCLTPSGIVKLRATLTNTGTTDYQLDALDLNLPVPTAAREVLDFSGRHLRERSPQRHAFTIGTYLREGRRGRTGPDATLLLAVGTPGFGFRSGNVWAVHTAWSGNHRTSAERTAAGTGLLAGGELLLPGEIRLGPAQSYTTPWIHGAFGAGLDEVSGRFHALLRARPGHPSGPRKVVLNTWEAVYFDHDLDKLTVLADRAAAVGVERFVLDDGWFRHRRSDRAGLGDWYVDETVWPHGLHPLISHVRSLDMDFGLWVEPEMINEDSDTARAHPEWIMSTGSRLPPAARHQQVLDLANPQAYAFVLERLDSLLTEYPIAFLKWDLNRDVVDGGHPLSGAAGVHDQTLAAYRLMDELLARHPGLEIESCSSGGSRVDLEILERTQRVWASDCNDALERQHIQRWTGLLVPPELIGSHVGAPLAHTTGRTHSLDFRCGTALFAHFGIEWDLTAASGRELSELAAWVALYRDVRELLHAGTVVRSDHGDPAHWVHGVVGPHGDALYAVVAVGTGDFTSPGAIQLPGLDPAGTYDVRPLSPATRTSGTGLRFDPPWWSDGTTATGAVLEHRGLAAPALPPESLVLLHVVRRMPTQHIAG